MGKDVADPVHGLHKANNIQKATFDRDTGEIAKSYSQVLGISNLFICVIVHLWRPGPGSYTVLEIYETHQNTEN